MSCEIEIGISIFNGLCRDLQLYIAAFFTIDTFYNYISYKIQKEFIYNHILPFPPLIGQNYNDSSIQMLVLLYQNFLVIRILRSV